MSGVVIDLNPEGVGKYKRELVDAIHAVVLRHDSGTVPIVDTAVHLAELAGFSIAGLPTAAGRNMAFARSMQAMSDAISRMRIELDARGVE